MGLRRGWGAGWGRQPPDSGAGIGLRLRWQHQRCQHLGEAESRIRPRCCCSGCWGLGNTRRKTGGEEEEGGKVTRDWGWGPGSKATWSPAPEFPDPPRVGRPGGLGGSLSDNLSGVPPAPGDNRNPRGGGEAAAGSPQHRSRPGSGPSCPLQHPRGRSRGRSPVGRCGEPPGRAAAGTPNLTAQPRLEAKDPPKAGSPPPDRGAHLTWKWPRTYLAMG